MINRFAVVLSADDVVRAKPAPDLYVLAAQRLGLEPARCVAVEDSAAGVAAARAAGCPVVGFTGFNDDKASLEGTALTIDRWGQLTYQRLLALIAESDFEQNDADTDGQLGGRDNHEAPGVAGINAAAGE